MTAILGDHSLLIVILSLKGDRAAFPRGKDLGHHSFNPDYNNPMKDYYVYIMTNASKTLYIGVTNNLIRRIDEHKNGKIKGFTSKYHITKLVYYEQGDNIETAINREKQLKGWLRSKKIALIESVNPDWQDLSEDWFR